MLDLTRKLLNAHAPGKPSEDSQRITAALGGALDEKLSDPDTNSAEALAAAERAFQQVSQEIWDEAHPPAPVPAGHADAFADGTGQDPGPAMQDAEVSDVVDVRLSDHFAPKGVTAPDDQVDVPDEDVDLDDSGHTHANDDGTGYADTDDEDTDDEDTDFDDADFDDTDGANDEGAPDDYEGEDMTVAPAADTPTEFSSSWGDAIELPTAPQSSPASAPEAPPTPDAPVENSAPAAPPKPSPRATPPPGPMEPPAPDIPDDSFAERMRKSVGGALHRVGSGDRRRTRWLVGGAAAAAALVIAGIVSLSGGRGEPPEPAGNVAAPPAQTENPAAPPTARSLVDSSTRVSSGCVTGGDAVAPFAQEKSRAWVCERANGLEGAVLNITFNKPVVVTEITMVPGFNYVAPDGRDEWDRHRQITGVTWRMGGQLFPRTINPTRTGVTMKFPSVVTQEMSMTITSSTRPAKVTTSGGIGKPGGDISSDVDATTAVSSIVITGYPVDPAS